MGDNGPDIKKGFTVSELLVVLMIISVFSGFVIISYNGFRNYLRLKSTSQEIVSLLSAARSMAINQNGYFRAGFLIDSGTMWVDEVDSFGNLSQPKVIHTKQIPELVKIVSITVDSTTYTEGVAYITFRPDGSAQYSTIYLRRLHTPDIDENYYTIKVFPGTGKTRVYPNQRR